MSDLSIEIPDALVDQLAERVLERVADLVAERLSASAPAPSPYMTIAEAADYLRCSRQRVDDLLSQRRLTRVKDGSRTLISRAELEGYVRGSA